MPIPGHVYVNTRISRSDLLVEESKLDDNEVIYHFVKGHGWIPETPLSKKLSRQAAKAGNFGYDFADVNYDTLEQDTLRVFQEQLLNDAQMWARQVPVVQTHDELVWYTTPQRRTPEEMEQRRREEREWREARTYRQTAPRDRYWTFDTETFGTDNVTVGNGRDARNGPREHPRTHTPDELIPQRYYPGTGQQAERREENIHERRQREYNEARERYRRGR